ncbi:MAG: hypothetical protein ACI4SH_08280 [Candidatus Scatosoma sp.]
MHSRFEKNILKMAEEHMISELSVSEILEALPRTVDLYLDMKTEKEKVPDSVKRATKQIIEESCAAVLSVVI